MLFHVKIKNRGGRRLGLSGDVGREFMNDDNDNRDDADGDLLCLDESQDYAPQDWLLGDNDNDWINYSVSAFLQNMLGMKL